MAKTYRTPTVASLGAAEVMTAGLTSGNLSEIAVGNARKTTHHMLDL